MRHSGPNPETWTKRKTKITDHKEIYNYTKTLQNIQQNFKKTNAAKTILEIPKH